MATSRSLLLALLLLALLPAHARGQAHRPLTLDDYGAWSRITGVELSPHGRWLAYVLEPNDGDATLNVKGLPDGPVYETVNGRDAAFSADGRWAALLSEPPEEQADALREEGEPVSTTLHLLDLDTGARHEHRDVRSFAFSPDGRSLAIHRHPADPEAEHEGSDLLLLHLDRGTSVSFGNVSEYAFDEEGDFLAYTVDASGDAGNGLYAVSVRDQRILPLDTEAETYEDLAWSPAAAHLTVLRGSVEEGDAERSNVLVVATELSGTRPAVSIYDPASDPGFPDGFVLSELADTRWTEDGQRIVAGLKEQSPEAEEEAGDETEAPDVDVWHWTDERLQSVQRVQAEADRRYTYAAVFTPSTGVLARLATEDMPRVDVPDRGRWAVGRRDVSYRGILDEDGGRADYVRIDMDTGAVEVFAEGVRRPMGSSPDGRWYLYAQDGAVHSVDLDRLVTTDLSESTGLELIDREFDRIAERPAYGLEGWMEEDRVLLRTRWDVWAVPLSGGAPESLSGGAGERDEIRYEVVRLDPESDWVDPDAVLLSAYGEWTKQSGYLRPRPGRDPEPLLFGDEMVRDLRKARDAERVVFTRQTFERFPDYWTSDPSLADPVRVTDANPQIGEFAWGRRMLVDYVDERGNELQATLTLPAGYEEGRRYPMVVYFYEKMSQRHHEFSRPVYDDRPHMSTYASNGYLVLMPDIVYDEGLPGSSALDDVTAAARRVIELGYADPDRIGLQGHSWGGYETSFILTQTDMFAAIVTGAPLTNLMSMNNILYKRSGNLNGPILQWSQGRMGDQPWDDFERWVSQSPVHHVPGISTPFLILHGTEDGAVDWNQGLELYAAARRLGKEVILLSYPGEPHHLGKEANQKDFQRRMMEFFDHHLKGADAPAWMTDGVPFLEKGKERDRKAVS